MLTRKTDTSSPCNKSSKANLQCYISHYPAETPISHVAQEQCLHFTPACGQQDEMNCCGSGTHAGDQHGDMLTLHTPKSHPLMCRQDSTGTLHSLESELDTDSIDRKISTESGLTSVYKRRYTRHHPAMSRLKSHTSTGTNETCEFHLDNRKKSTVLQLTEGPHKTDTGRQFYSNLRLEH